jgi:hypothetical protein
MLRTLRRPPAKPSIQAAHLPAPIGGMNRFNAASAMPPEDCLYLYNLIAAEYVLRSRLGYQEWCTGLTGAADNEVRSILPFTGSAMNGAGDKLFATTSSGIWGVSASTDTPSLVQAFGTTTGDAGWGVSCVASTSAGRHLLYFDEVNGMFVYSEGGAWGAVAMGGGGSEIANVDPANLVFGTVFKDRLWMVERDTAKAWYLSAGAIYGAATSFDFGQKMRSGGPLRGLWNWSYDGGGGLDTLLCGISGSGDVVIYQGTDPSSINTFALKGAWSLGGVPAGRRFATDQGGEILVASLLGVLPLSRLVAGGSIDDEKLYATRKVGPYFSLLASTYKSLKGWSVLVHPEDNALMVTVPTAAGAATNQLAMAFSTKAWSQYRDLPILSAASWNGQLYFGTTDGRVCRNTGYVDNVLLSDPNSWNAVQWSLLTAYQSLGTPRYKRVHSIRPKLLSQAANATVQATALMDFNLIEPAPPAGGSGGSGSTWDSAVWDTSVWSGDYTATQPLQGGTGIGRDVAIAVRGSAIARTTLVGVDVLFELGGVL